MNRRQRLTTLTAAAMIAGLCVPFALRAQDASPERSVQFGVMAGIEYFTGDAKGDSRATGEVFTALLQYPLGVRRLALRGDFSYHKYDLCTNTVNPFNGGTGCPAPPFEALVSWSADVVARLNDPHTRWSPYALVGAGLYTGVQNASAPSALGMQAGIGFEVRPANTAVFFAEWRYLDTSIAGLEPMTIGVRF